MTEFSGRTTMHAHKRDDWESAVIDDFIPALSQKTIFNVQWSDCPVEVEDEIRKLWKWQELRNDNCYFNWKRSEEHAMSLGFDCPTDKETLDQFGETDDDDDGDYLIELRYAFPLTDKFLMSKGVTECLIHWWW